MKDYEHDNENEHFTSRLGLPHKVFDKTESVTQGCSLNKARMVILQCMLGNFENENGINNLSVPLEQCHYCYMTVACIQSSDGQVND